VETLSGGLHLKERTQLTVSGSGFVLGTRRRLAYFDQGVVWVKSNKRMTKRSKTRSF
jgi:hypothetical protein